jgi:uncharacterized membrane protein YcaP (DUF421 family)
MEVVLRAAVVFVFLWILTRVIGKKELAELSTFELVLIVSIGDLVQQGVTQEDMSITGALLSAGTIALLVVAVSYVGYRWRGARRVIEGEPVTIVDDGRPIDDAMAVERLTLDEVLASAREQGIADLAGVRYAVLEPDGTFSFVKASGGDHGEPPPDKPS